MAAKRPKKFIKRPKVVEIVKSPSISRRIPDLRLPALTAVLEKELLVGFACGCLVVAIFFSGLRAYNLLQAYKGVLQEKKALLQQKSYWQGITEKYPSYRDAHLRLGVLAYQEGNHVEARNEATKALDLDPSFAEARIFLEKVGK